VIRPALAARIKPTQMAAPRTCLHCDNGFDLLGIVEEKMAGILGLDRFFIRVIRFSSRISQLRDVQIRQQDR
jgi:hypothetical protein